MLGKTLFSCLLLHCFRQFAGTIKRPFAVRYNPYTQSLDVLDNTRLIATVVSELKGDLCIVSDALRRLQLLEQQGTRKSSHDTVSSEIDTPRSTNRENVLETSPSDAVLAQHTTSNPQFDIQETSINSSNHYIADEENP